MSHYNAAVLADSILSFLEQIEQESDTNPECQKYRSRTGLICAAEHRNPLGNRRDVEDAITRWLAEFFPNAVSQDTHAASNKRPDIVFTYDDDSRLNQKTTVYLEAKPVWKSWITSGEFEYGNTPDTEGRCHATSHKVNIDQVVSDRDKLLNTYTDPNDRHLLLALVFQRPEELDEQLISAVGPGWTHHKRHILDRCNPPGDNIGVTGMVFWPDHES